MPAALRLAASSARIASHRARSFSAFSRASADCSLQVWTWASYSCFHESLSVELLVPSTGTCSAAISAGFGDSGSDLAVVDSARMGGRTNAWPLVRAL